MIALADSGALGRESARRQIREFSGKRDVSARAKSTQALKGATVNLLWWGAHHSETLKIRAKTRRYGRWRVDRNAKATGFSGVDTLGKKWGSGIDGRKMRVPARKARSLWFSPPQTTRIFAQTERNDAQNL